MIPRSQTLTFKKRDGQKTSIFLAAGGVRSPSPTTVAMVTDEVHTTFTSLCLFGIRSTVWIEVYYTLAVKRPNSSIS